MDARAPARWIALTALLTLALAAPACRQAHVDPEGAREAREAMLFTVASQFREPAASLGVLDFEPVTFKDACLEIQRRGPCPTAPTPGYRLRLTRRGDAYEYRAPAASPSDAALAQAPDPRVGTPALSWTWADAPGGCQTLVVTNDARPVLGWCDGPMAALPWLEGQFSAAEWSYLHDRFGPFALTGDPMIQFAGTGADSASASWRTAIERWASLRWSELRAGRSGAAHGRALSYRRTVQGRAGSCDVLEVTEYGVAYLGRSMCEGGGGEAGKAAWLSDDLWKQMNGWLHTWAPYTDAEAGLYFFGTGRHTPTAAEARELMRWCDQAMAHVAYTDREAWPTP